MSGRGYARLTIETFGAHLLASGDLDPLYIALRRAAWSRERLGRFLMAYWCTYHVGTACYLADQDSAAFWVLLNATAANEEPAPIGGRWQRGHERRHWRGNTAAKAVMHLRERYGDEPHVMAWDLANAAPSYGAVTNLAKSHYSFGDWIAFKIADMVDRVLETRVDFSTDDVFMFDSPTEAAIQVWRVKAMGVDRLNPIKPKDPAAVIRQVVRYLGEHFSDTRCMHPLDDRPVNLQEIETILCKWKSHMNGHYPLDNDIHEINDGLRAWSKTSLSACELLKAMPVAFSPG